MNSKQNDLTIYIHGLADMKKIIEDIPICKMVFWIGAGIDKGAPTSLPLGEDLTTYILQQACGKRSQRLINIWEKNQRLIQEISEDGLEISKKPRLETVIEILREFEKKQINKQSLIAGFQSFSSKEISYNKEHTLLAEFLHKGANIVTTNYGDFIYKAYKEKYPDEPIVHEYDDVYLYRGLSRGVGYIYHIHGISEDLETIGANLTNVKASLPISFRKQFSHWINNGHVIIFMGYSGFDSLDVNPFLEEFGCGTGKIGIYVRHTSNQNVMPASEKEKILLHPFVNRYICPCNTSDFFELLKGNIGIRSSLADNNLNRDNMQTNWKCLFSKYGKVYDPDSANTVLLGMCYQLGISIVELFNTKRWLPIVFKSKNVDPEYKYYYAFQNAIMTGQKRIVKKQGENLSTKTDVLITSDLQHMRGEESKDLEEPCEGMLRNVKEIIANRNTITWKISTALNRHVMYIYKRVLFRSIVLHNNVIKQKHLDVIHYAKECLQIIINGKYDCVNDVNQIHTAYRTLALCQSIQEVDLKDINKNIDIALRNYADISSMHGIGMTLLIKAIIFFRHYKLTRNVEYLKKGKAFLEKAHIIIHNCGMKKYHRQYLFTCVIYAFLKLEFIIQKKNEDRHIGKTNK